MNLDDIVLLVEAHKSAEFNYERLKYILSKWPWIRVSCISVNATSPAYCQSIGGLCFVLRGSGRIVIGNESTTLRQFEWLRILPGYYELYGDSDRVFEVALILEVPSEFLSGSH